MPGFLNDINIIEASSLCEKFESRLYPPTSEYRVNSVRRNEPFWLCDGIYCKCSIFLTNVMGPVTNKKKLVAKVQEATRKDIEWALASHIACDTSYAHPLESSL